MHFKAFLLHASLALAAPAALDERASAAAPSVSIQHGTVIGVTNTTTKIDSFLGIPYAKPPTGDRRLKPPHPITKSFGTFKATKQPTSCPQQQSNLDKSVLPKKLLKDLKSDENLKEVFGVAESKVNSTEGEDCLTINVQRPAGAKSGAKLPVVYWIFGGSFETGSTADWDATLMLNKSRALGKEFIFVQANYRLGAFGFLAGKELQQDGSTNLGLRDQRLALEWIQDNIAAFGGDPARVTMFGESAGSKSVFDHLLINGGDNSYKSGSLFIGGIMDSGSAYPASSATSSNAQVIYDTVVKEAGCSHSNDTLACLRAAPYEKLYNASSSLPSDLSYQSMDLAYVPRFDPSNSFYCEHPYTSLANGAYTKVPIINGDQADEGNLFAIFQKNVTTTAQVETYFRSWYPAAKPALIAQLVSTYPATANGLYPQFKRMAGIIGDVIYIMARRVCLMTMADSMPAIYSYRATYFDSTADLGTFHGTDKNLIFDGKGPSVPTESILTFYISFINYGDPNRISTKSPLIPWPKYTTASPSLMNFGNASNTIVQDTFREQSYQILSANRFAFTL